MNICHPLQIFGPHCKIDNPAPPPAPPPLASITEVQWGDGDAVPADIREWFGKRRVFGLVARVEGLREPAELERFFGNADLRVTLECEGESNLTGGLNPGAWWWKDDHAWVVVKFGDAASRAHVAARHYVFVCRNHGGGNQWRVTDGVRVPPRK